MAAFITFEETKCVNIMEAVSQFEKSQMWGFGLDRVSPMKASEAPIPTNIKWEHRNKAGFRRRCKYGLIYLIIVLGMLFSLLLIFSLRAYFQKFYTPFRRLDCEEYFKQFGVDMESEFAKTFIGSSGNN